MDSKGNQMTDKPEEPEFSNDVDECKILYVDIKEECCLLAADLVDDAENGSMSHDPTWRRRATKKLSHLNAEKYRLYHWLLKLGCTDFDGPRTQIALMSDAHKRKIQNMQAKHELTLKEKGRAFLALFNFISSEFGDDALKKAYEIHNAAQIEFRSEQKETR